MCKSIYIYKIIIWNGAKKKDVYFAVGICTYTAHTGYFMRFNIFIHTHLFHSNFQFGLIRVAETY